MKFTEANYKQFFIHLNNFDGILSVAYYIPLTHGRTDGGKVTMLQ